MQKTVKYVIVIMIFFWMILGLEKNILAEDVVNVKSERVEAVQGDTVKVTFSVSGNPGTTMYEMTIIYDTDVLSVVSVEGGGIYPEWFPTDVAIKPLYISAGDALSLENITEDCVLATVCFKIAEDAKAGEYKFQIQNGLFLNADLDAYEVLYDDSGCVVVGTEAESQSAGNMETEKNQEADGQTSVIESNVLDKNYAENKTERDDKGKETQNDDVVEEESDNHQGYKEAVSKDVITKNSSSNENETGIKILGAIGGVVLLGLFVVAWKKERKNRELR